MDLISYIPREYLLMLAIVAAVSVSILVMTGWWKPLLKKLGYDVFTKGGK